MSVTSAEVSRGTLGVNSLSQRTSRPVAPNRASVLVVIHGDHFGEVFTGDGVNVHVAHMPFVGTNEGEIAAESWLEANLPNKLRNIYFPGNRRASFVFDRVTPAQIADRLSEAESMKAIDRIADRLRRKGLIQ